MLETSICYTYYFLVKVGVLSASLQSLLHSACKQMHSAVQENLSSPAKSRQTAALLEIQYLLLQAGSSSNVRFIRIYPPSNSFSTSE